MRRKREMVSLVLCLTKPCGCRLHSLLPGITPIATAITTRHYHYIYALPSFTTFGHHYHSHRSFYASSLSYDYIYASLSYTSVVVRATIIHYFATSLPFASPSLLATVFNLAVSMRDYCISISTREGHDHHHSGSGNSLAKARCSTLHNRSPHD